MNHATLEITDILMLTFGVVFHIILFGVFYVILIMLIISGILAFAITGYLLLIGLIYLHINQTEEMFSEFGVEI